MSTADTTTVADVLRALPGTDRGLAMDYARFANRPECRGFDLVIIPALYEAAQEERRWREGAARIDKSALFSRLREADRSGGDLKERARGFRDTILAAARVAAGRPVEAVVALRRRPTRSLTKAVAWGRSSTGHLVQVPIGGMDAFLLAAAHWRLPFEVLGAGVEDGFMSEVPLYVVTSADGVDHELLRARRRSRGAA